MARTRIVSGIQPSGDLHVGNYVGAIKNFIALQAQKEYDCYFFIADLHSLSENYHPKEKAEDIYKTVAALIALGLDPSQCTLFVQSQISAHAELAWLFSTVTPIAELERMTQFKDKAARQVKNINAALLIYPVLQAADILLYHGERIPVGKDQEQHVEMTRLIAKKMNKLFKTEFPEPKPLLTRMPKIMSLRDPEKKMSKSLGSQHVLNIFDDEKTTEKKITKAITSSTMNAKDPGSANLITLFEEFSQTELPKSFSGLKSKLSKDINEYFAAPRKRYAELLANSTQLDIILEEGRKKASPIAFQTLYTTKQKMGLL